MSPSDAVRVVAWLVRDTFRQSLESRVAWLMLGLVGLGILPGPLRKPLGVAGLVGPADYAGRTLAVQRSRVTEETLRTLGAREQQP